MTFLIITAIALLLASLAVYEATDRRHHGAPPASHATDPTFLPPSHSAHLRRIA